MRKIILTSAGFDNKKIGVRFIELLGKPVEHAKVLFIPTAAITVEQKAVVPLCKQDLLEVGILDNNISIYDFENTKDSKAIREYDAIYVCGGDTRHLLNKFNEGRLDVEAFINSGGVYVGVSAGSIVLAQNLENNLGYINCQLNVHKKEGHKPGSIDISNCPTINLTDNQAIVINNQKIEIIQ